MLCSRSAALAELGEAGPALEAAEAAVARATAAAGRWKGNNNVRLGLAEALGTRADRLAADPPRRNDAIRDGYSPAALILRDLYQDHDQVPHYRRNLAEIMVRRAEALLAEGRLPAAAKDLGVARTVIEPRLKGPSIAAADRLVAGRLAGAEARLARADGQPDRARTLYDRAVADLETALEGNPDDARNRRRLDAFRAERRELDDE